MQLFSAKPADRNNNILFSRLFYISYVDRRINNKWIDVKCFINIAAIDQMVEKTERQIRQQRGKARRKRSNLSVSKVSTRRGKSASEVREEMEIPSITQRKQTPVKPMSLEEAVAQMDLSEEEFLVFINSDSGQMNVLHRGKDGGYEWVEPYSE